MNHSSFLIRLSLCGLLLILGCGGDSGPSYDRVPVKGTLTVDGEPIAYGSIGFLPDPDDNVEGPAIYADVRNGEFDIPQERGPVAGQHFVEIEVYGPEPTDPEESAELIGSVRTMTVIPEAGLTDYNFDGSKRAMNNPDREE